MKCMTASACVCCRGSRALAFSKAITPCRFLKYNDSYRSDGPCKVRSGLNHGALHRPTNGRHVGRVGDQFFKADPDSAHRHADGCPPTKTGDAMAGGVRLDSTFFHAVHTEPHRAASNSTILLTMGKRRPAFTVTKVKLSRK